MTRTPDAVNQDIWTSSPAIHRQASFREDVLVCAGRIGAQQGCLIPQFTPNCRREASRRGCRTY